MKKAISLCAALFLLLGVLTVPASARGGGGGFCGGVGRQTQASQQQQVPLQTLYEACTVEGCTELGLHAHDGVYYRCAYYDPAICPVAGSGAGIGGGVNCPRLTAQ